MCADCEKGGIAKQRDNSRIALDTPFDDREPISRQVTYHFRYSWIRLCHHTQRRVYGRANTSRICRRNEFVSRYRVISVQLLSVDLSSRAFKVTVRRPATTCTSSIPRDIFVTLFTEDLRHPFWNFQTKPHRGARMYAYTHLYTSFWIFFRVYGAWRASIKTFQRNVIYTEQDMRNNGGILLDISSEICTFLGSNACYTRRTWTWLYTYMYIPNWKVTSSLRNMQVDVFGE